MPITNAIQTVSVPSGVAPYIQSFGDDADIGLVIRTQHAGLPVNAITISGAGVVTANVPPLAVLVQTATHTYTVTSNGTLVSVDTTNLQTTAFIVPPSGKILAMLQASVFPNSATVAGLWWAVRVGGVDSSVQNAIGSISTGNPTWLPLCTTYHQLTGLTPGASVVATWRAAIDAASSINMFSGGSIGNGQPGPAIMIITAA